MTPTFFNPESANSPIQPKPVAVPSPPSFRAPLLPLKLAAFGKWKYPAAGETAAQRAGIRYEQKVHSWIGGQYFQQYHPNQVIAFRDQRGWGEAIPDGLLFTRDALAIVEIKAQHSPESWWQLRKKYEPLVRFIAPQERVLLIEICKQLDASMPYPEKFSHVEDLGAFLSEAKDGQLGVLQWTP